MKLFTVGPVEMYPETLKIGAMPEPYFRTPEFSATMKKIEKNFLESIYAAPETSFAALTCSGTGAMDAAISACFTQKDKLIVIRGGSFGKRFGEICDVYHIPYDSIDLSFGEGFKASMLDKFEGKGYTALVVNLSETSTGQGYDANLLGDFCKRNNMYFIVDAVSAYLADYINMEKMHIDLLLTASQKALSLAPGLALIATGKKLTEERIMKNEPKSYYLNLKDYYINQKRGQPPFTSAVSTIFMLEQRLDSIMAKGMDAVIKEHAERATYFRNIAKKLNLSIPSYHLSNSCTPVIFENGGAKKIYEELKDKYDTYLTPSGGDLADKQLRVGHLGNLTLKDYDDLYTHLKEIM